MSNPTELPDLDYLQQLAQAAHDCENTEPDTHYQYVVEFTPDRALALIALARRAQPYATGGMVPNELLLVGEGLPQFRAQPESGAPAALEQAAALVVKMTAPPRDLLGAPAAAMKATASLGERIAAAIRAITLVAAQSQGAQSIGWQVVPTSPAVAQGMWGHMELALRRAMTDAGYNEPADIAAAKQWNGNATHVVRSIIAAATRHAEMWPNAAQQPAAPDAMTSFRKWHQEVGDQDCEYTWLQAWTAAQLSKSASAPGTPEAPKTAAARDVLAERQRQMEVEGWTPAHDNEHADGQMAGAAACYAVHDITHWARAEITKTLWPWASEWWKPRTKRENLIRAGALVLAEIERLDRAAQLDGGQGGSESNG